MLVPSATSRPASVGELLGPDLMAQLDRLDVLSRKMFSGKLPGERRSKRRGSSVEFEDYRDYTPGDDLRRIDWNVYARLDRLLVRIFRDEQDLALHLVVDASLSMDAGTPSKLVAAQRLAMALGYIGLVNQNRVLASIVGAPGRATLQQLSPVRGRRHMATLGRFLLEHVWPPPGHVAVPGPPPSLSDALRALALGRRGRGVMIVFSDFLVREDLARGLNYLGVGGLASFDVACVQILSPGELDPAREGEGQVVGDLRLIDAETGQAAEVTVSPALVRHYRRRLEAHVAALHAMCTARGMMHVLVRSNDPPQRLILDSLRRRGLIG